jgi:hypothetical protein
VELTMIAERTGLAPRLLRYVVYHGVLPGLERVGAGGQGATRSYTPFEAFGIAVSAMLLDAGLKRGVVQDSLAILCRKLPRGPVAVSAIPLLGAMHSGGTVGIEVAEARYVRLRMEGGTAPPYLKDTGWLAPKGSPPPPADYDPVVVVSLNPTTTRNALLR